MSISYTLDARVWIAVPAKPADGWARSAAESLARAQGVQDEEQVAWLAVLAAEAAGLAAGDEDARLMCVTDIRRGAMVLDLAWIDLGEDAPDAVDVDEAATGQTEEFTADLVSGKRIIWVSPADADVEPAVGATSDPLQGQVLYVGRLAGSGYLITMRSGLHQLDLIVDSVEACEQMLATVRAD